MAHIVIYHLPSLLRGVKAYCLTEDRAQDPLYSWWPVGDSETTGHHFEQLSIDPYLGGLVNVDQYVGLVCGDNKVMKVVRRPETTLTAYFAPKITRHLRGVYSLTHLDFIGGVCGAHIR